MVLEQVPVQTATATRFIKVWASSSSLAVSLDTDQGEYVAKVRNNPEGPRVLVNEWLGSSLARLLGILTPNFAIIDVPSQLKIELRPGLVALSGPAFGSQFEQGQTWGGKSSVAAVANPEIFSQLVVLDTWLLNVDRYSVSDGHIRKNPQNLWLSEEGAPPGKFLLKAIDHGHCFRGTTWRATDLNKIDWVKDPNIFGMFPEFAELLKLDQVRATLERAAGMTRKEGDDILKEVPESWSLSPTDAQSLVEFLLDRARYLRTTLPGSIWPQQMLNGDREGI